MNVTLLAQHMNARRQQLGIARTMRRVTIQAILADGGMFPEKRPPFFRMAGVTHIIYGQIHEHLAPLPAMRIVAGSAADLHVAKLGAEQMGGALEKIFSLLNVATETSFFDSETGQHFLGQPGIYDLCCFAAGLVGQVRQHAVQHLDMVNVVARQATHIASVVPAALPVEMTAIHRVALQARIVGLSWCHFRWIVQLNFPSALSVLFAIAAMTNLALGAARIRQELCTLAVSIEAEGHDDAVMIMAPRLAVLSHDGPFS